MYLHGKHCKRPKESNKARKHIPTGVIWHNTCVPSIPTQLNVVWGKVLLCSIVKNVIEVIVYLNIHIVPSIYAWLKRWTKERHNDTHHDSFCVKNHFIPAPLINCGYEPVKPKLSGSHAVSHRTPNLVWKYRWPNVIWRMSDSPDGILPSFSTQDPPIGWKACEATLSLTRENSLG